MQFKNKTLTASFLQSCESMLPPLAPTVILTFKLQTPSLNLIIKASLHTSALKAYILSFFTNSNLAFSLSKKKKSCILSLALSLLKLWSLRCPCQNAPFSFSLQHSWFKSYGDPIINQKSHKVTGFGCFEKRQQYSHLKWVFLFLSNNHRLKENGFIPFLELVFLHTKRKKKIKKFDI